MAASKSFASLSPRLLARKGGAKPAMRPQVQPLIEFHDAVSGRYSDGLGWNDMGGLSDTPRRQAPVIPPRRQPLVCDMPRSANSRRSAQGSGKRAAFTLRIDAERHSRLRLACAATNRSAQQLLTDALDRMLADMPEIAMVAGKSRKRS